MVVDLGVQGTPTFMFWVGESSPTNNDPFATIFGSSAEDLLTVRSTVDDALAMYDDYLMEQEILMEEDMEDMGLAQTRSVLA